MDNPFKSPLVKTWKKLKSKNSVNAKQWNRNRQQEFNETLEKCPESSFEFNQSFPKVTKHNKKNELNPFVTPRRQNKKKMDKIRVDGFNGLRFTPYRAKGGFTPQGSPYGNSFLNPAAESLMRIPKSGINPNKAVFTIDSKTSNILIVNQNACSMLGYSSRELCDSKFSDLLACKNKIHVSALAENQLNSEDGTMILLSGKVVEMISKIGHRIPVSLWIRQIDNDGRCLAVAEPVERRVAQIIIDTNGEIVSADNEALMLFQLETLEKFVGMEVSVLIPAVQLPENHDGNIPKHVKKQKATGKTQDGVSFPLCVMITPQENLSSDVIESGLNYYTITIWVYSNLSGLIVIDENSIIESCNHHFSTLMFGYPQTKIIGQNIFKLIPNFGQEFEYIDTRSRRSSSVENEESETETDHILLGDPFSLQFSTMSSSATSTSTTSRKDPNKICLDFTSPRQSNASSLQLKPFDEAGKVSSQSSQPNHSQNRKNSTNFSDKLENSENNKNFMNLNAILSGNAVSVPPSTSNDQEDTLLTPVNEMGSSVLDSVDSPPKNPKPPEPGSAKNLITSTPDTRKKSDPKTHVLLQHQQSLQQQHQQFNYNYPDGRYRGLGVHADGNIIDIVYTISKSRIIPTNQTIYCVWISRDPDSECNNVEEDEDKQLNLTLTLNSLTSTVENSTGPGANKVPSNMELSARHSLGGAAGAANSSRPNSVSLMSQCEEEQVSGEYSKYYTTLKQIGKGAYGYVKMAYRNSDRLLVISKFILKEKLCSNFMIKTDDSKEIPMEIYLLTHVKHPNIVNVLDVFENEKFFQLIMEKHGSGMDLFEFIDRRPLIDEKLGCYIFRQIARAVDYLHSLNILHRDIKDENIIIDHNFHIKLIDFGSATFMQEGKLFSTFYGTTEYCSPEVLAGNKYQGPELEVWSLGVTLYVLMFFENPFLDVEDTLRADVLIPHEISKPLECLLLRMLDKDPKTRMTMKELLQNDWINMEIVNNFNFQWIVPCEPHEATPEVYYNGQIYSSTTALSTSHDSLSMVDDDSMIDQDDQKDEDAKNTVTTPQQVQSFCDYTENKVETSTSLPEMTQNLIELSINSASPINCNNKLIKADDESPLSSASDKNEEYWEQYYLAEKWEDCECDEI